jgi:hypothetical protein
VAHSKQSASSRCADAIGFYYREVPSGRRCEAQVLSERSSWGEAPNPPPLKPPDIGRSRSGRAVGEALHNPASAGALPRACPRWRDNVTDDYPGCSAARLCGFRQPIGRSVQDNSAITASESALVGLIPFVHEHEIETCHPGHRLPSVAGQRFSFAPTAIARSTAATARQ